MATPNATYRQIAPSPGAVLSQGLHSICRAGRRIATTRRSQWGDHILVEPYQDDEDSAEEFVEHTARYEEMLTEG